MKKMVVLMTLVLLIATVFLGGELTSIIPALEDEAVTITLSFDSAVKDSNYNLESNPSRTIYSLSVENTDGKEINLPFRGGPVEGLWVRDVGDKLSINVALIIPAIRTPEVTASGNNITLKFWRSSNKVEIERFNTYSMNLSTVLTYLFSNELLNMSYVITENVRAFPPVSVGFTSSHPEDILRNILISLGDRVSYAYLTDGTFYLGSPDEVRNIVNSFWKTYIGVDIKLDGETSQDQLENLRKALPVESFVEYIPNESTLLAFGDLQTHMLLSSLLTSSYITREYDISFDNLLDGSSAIIAFEELAKKINTFLCNDTVVINTLEEFNRLVLGGSQRYINTIVSYLDSYEKVITAKQEASKLKLVTVKLPENFRIVEDIINSRTVSAPIDKIGFESSNETEAATPSNAGETEDSTNTTAQNVTQKQVTLTSERVTMVDIIISLIQAFVPDQEIFVDRSFEIMGKITFEIPESVSGIFDAIIRDLNVNSQNITYSILRNLDNPDPLILNQVQSISGVLIESLSNGSYIVKGEKDRIETAEYLISQFASSPYGLQAYKYIELRDEEGYDTIKEFLETYFASQNLGPDTFGVEKIGNKLLYISAPEEYLENALIQIGKYEKYFFVENQERLIEMNSEIYENGIGDLLNTLFAGKLELEFVPSVNLLLIRGTPEDLNSAVNLIGETAPKIKTRLALDAIEESEQRSSKLIGTIPGWDYDKFNSYFTDFLGGNLAERINVIPSSAGYLVVTDEIILETIETEADRLREIEEPYFSIVGEIPPIEELNSLFDKMGIKVEIMPIESKYMLVGTRANVLRADDLLKTIMGSFTKNIAGSSTVTSPMMSYSFVDIVEGSADDFNAILTKLNIKAELISSPGGALVIGYENQVVEASAIIDSIMSRNSLADGQTNTNYLMLQTLEDVTLDSLKTLISNFSYRLSVFNIGDNLIVIGPEEDLNGFKEIYNNLYSSNNVIEVINQSIDFEDLNSLINNLSTKVNAIKTQNKYVLYGERSDVEFILNLIKEIAPPSTVQDNQSEQVVFEKTYATISLPEGFSRDSLKNILNSLGIGVELIASTDTIVIVGEKNSVNNATEVVTNLHGINKRPEAVELNYQVFDMPEGLDLVTVREALTALNIPTQILKSDEKLLLIGTGREISETTTLIDHLKPDGTVKTQVKEAKIYSIVSIPGGLNADELQNILRRIGVNVDVILVGNTGIMIGAEKDILEGQNVMATLLKLNEKPTELIKLNYKALDYRTSLSIVELTELLDRIGIVVDPLEVAGKFVLIGTDDEIVKAEQLMQTFMPEETDAATIVEKTYRLVAIPDGFEISDLQTITRKIGINVEIIMAGSVTLLVGEREEIDRAESVITTLAALETKPEELISYSYKVVTGTRIEEEALKEIFIAVGLNVKLISLPDFTVLTGQDDQILRAVDIIESLNEKTGKEPETKPLEYFLMEKSVDIGTEQLSKIISSLDISVQFVEAGPVMIMIGDAQSIELANTIVRSITENIKNAASSDYVPVSYRLVQMPAAPDANQLKAVATVLKLNIQFENIGDKLLLVGAENDLTKILDLLKETTPEPSIEISKVMKILKDLSGIDQETLKSYLVAQGVNLAELFEIKGGYLAVGEEGAVSEAEKVVDYLYENQQSYYQFIDVVPPVDSQLIEALIGNLSLSAEVVELSKTKLLVSGNSSDIEQLKDIISVANASGTNGELLYRKIKLNTGISTEELLKVLEELGIEITAVPMGEMIVFISSGETMENAMRIIEDLNNMIDSRGTDEKSVKVLPEVLDWDQDQLKVYLESLDIEIDHLFQYDNSMIGVADRLSLDRAVRALKFLADTSRESHTRYIKGIITDEQLLDIIQKLNIDVAVVDLDNQWLFSGKEDILNDLIKLMEDFERENPVMTTRYITDFTLDITELSSLLKESIPDLEVINFNNLKLMLLKAKDTSTLDLAEASVKELEENKTFNDELGRSIHVNSGKISIDVENAGIEKVLTVVANKMGISLMFNESIDENITMSIKDVEWKDLIEVITSTRQIDITSIAGIYTVSKKKVVIVDPEDSTEEQIYHVYHNMQEISDLITFYGGEVHRDEVNGILVVRNISRKTVKEIFEEAGSGLTEPKKQVLIKTMLLDSSLDDDLKSKLEASFGFQNPNLAIDSAGKMDLSFNIIDAVDFSNIIKGFAETGSASISAEFSNTIGDTEVVAEPSVVAMSGVPSLIHIGDDIPQLVTKKDSEGNITEEIETVTTGVKLDITPTINDDGTIVLEMTIEVSDPEKYPIGERTLYGKKTRTVQTKLIIEDGNTLVIGGLVQNSDKNNTTKVPFLGDLPFVGKLFTSIDNDSTQRELTIFLTATVVEP